MVPDLGEALPKVITAGEDGRRAGAFRESP
jgi:hypothetical protein